LNFCKWPVREQLPVQLPIPTFSILGVDGGGTKTHIALMNAEGKVTCEGLAGPSNPLRVGVETAVSNILKAINEACDRSGLSRGDIAAATLGLAGVRRADLRQRIRESFNERMRVRKTEVTTDAEIALVCNDTRQTGHRRYCRNGLGLFR
jgi:N-acetylglucosamine kinase-like BadF-type ATPase